MIRNDREEPADFTQELIQFIHQLVPYVIMSQASGFNPVYLIVFPVIIRMISYMCKKLYNRYWVIEDETEHFIQYFSRDQEGGENRVFEVLNWFLSKHMDELKVVQLSCEDYIFFNWGDCRAVDRFEPIYELAHKQHDRDGADPEIHFNFKDSDLRIVPSIESKKVGKDTIERKALTIYAENLTLIREFAQHSKDEYEEASRNESKKYYQYFEWDDDDKKWRSNKIHTNKTFENVFLEEELQENLIKTIDTFIKKKDFHEKVGVPHKKGMIFYGTPGCGKTSTEYAIANHYKRNIYVVRLDELSSSDKLKKAIMRIEENAVVVFEDIDTHKVTHQRRSKQLNKKKNTKRNSKSESENEDSCSESENEEDDEDGSEDDSKNPKAMFKNMMAMQRRMMMQGNWKTTTDDDTDMVLDFSSDWNTGLFQTLLEVMDGYNFLPGAIIIFTTNYIEKLDDALIRYGRIDHKYEFGFPSKKTICKIFRFFFELNESDPRLEQIMNIKQAENFSSAELINSIIMPNIDHPNDAFQAYLVRANEEAKVLPKLPILDDSTSDESITSSTSSSSSSEEDDE